MAKRRRPGPDDDRIMGLEPLHGPWPTHEDELAVVGLALRGAHLMELAADYVLAGCLGTSLPVAGNLRGETGMSVTLRMIRSVVHEPGCGLPVEAVLEWLALAEPANRVRNRVVHGSLIDDGLGHIRQMIVPGYGLVERSVDDIRADGRHLHDVGQRGMMLAHGARPGTERRPGAPRRG